MVVKTEASKAPTFATLPQDTSPRIIGPETKRRVERRRNAFVVLLCASATLGWLCLTRMQRYGAEWFVWQRHGQDSADVIGRVDWRRCDGLGEDPRAQCGTITCAPFLCARIHTDLGPCRVPLDYIDSDAGTAQIALARYRATSSPRKGMVLINPGGPGKSCNCP